MHVISRRRLREFYLEHADVIEALDDWFLTVSKSSWHNLIELQNIYPQAEAVSNFTVFNVKGKKYRLIASINYEKQIVYVKYVLTHAEYDKDKWKNDRYY